MHVSIPSISREYVRNQVQVIEDGVEVDPTSTVVNYAFLLEEDNEEPTESDWLAGGWETDVHGRHFSRILIGPAGGSIQLEDGTYNVWVRIHGTTERPVRNTGTLTIT